MVICDESPKPILAMLQAEASCHEQSSNNTYDTLRQVNLGRTLTRISISRPAMPELTCNLFILRQGSRLQAEAMEGCCVKTARPGETGNNGRFGLHSRHMQDVLNTVNVPASACKSGRNMQIQGQARSRALAALTSQPKCKLCRVKNTGLPTASNQA